MVTMLLFAKTAFASPRWLRGARRFAGFLALAPDRGDARKARLEPSLAVFVRRIFAPEAFGARRVAARTFPSGADASRPSGAAACESEALVARALLPVRFASVLTVGVFVSIRIFVRACIAISLRA